jgi:protein N-terminal methyltransferase
MAAASESDPDSCISAADGRSYWEGVEATEDGMLGGIPSIRGFSSISQMDIDSSRRFLSRIGISAKRGRQSLASVLEGGAG